MKKPCQQCLRAFLVLLLVFIVVLCPGFALEQRQPRPKRPLSKPPSLDIDNLISVLQPMILGCELPNAHLHLVIKGFAGDPREGWEYIQLKDGRQARILHTLNDLRGHVSITDGPTALRYVRLLTSPETWFLWKQNRLEVEILEAGEALFLPNYGLQEQSHSFSSPTVMTGIKGGFQDTAWEYDGRTRKMRLIRRTYRNGKSTNRVLKTMTPPDFTLMGDGSMGILTRKAYRAGGFAPAAVVPVAGGFQITRWLYSEGVGDNREAGSARQIQEFVGADGTYRRTLLKTRSAPSLPNARLTIPKFE